MAAKKKITSGSPKIVPEKVEEVPRPSKNEESTLLKEDIGKIIKVPKTRGALPTLVTYPAGESVLKRYVIVDIGPIELEKAWKLYNERVPNGSAEQFLLIVYNLTESEIPRMYRAVSQLSLL